MLHGKHDELIAHLIQSGVYSVTSEGKVFSSISNKFVGEGRRKRYVNIEYTDPNGKTFYFLKHRIVYIGIHGKIPNQYPINHEDGNKANNHPKNLVADTQSYNVKHSFRTGLQPAVPIGEKNWNAKLTNAEVEEIKRRYKAALLVAHRRGKSKVVGSESTRGLAKEFDVSPSLISAIILGKRRTK